MSELISVIMPVYNVEIYLSKCLKSVINQTYENLEIILVDDGSSDKSGQICDEFAIYDKRIMVIHQENRGISDARNRALDEINGEYVVFIDSDDCVGKFYVQNLYFLAKKYSVNIAITSFCLNFKYLNECEITHEKVLIHSSKQCLKNMFYDRFYGHYVCHKIYKSEIFKYIRFPKGKIYEDIAISPELLKKVQKIAFCNVKDYFYRRHRNSLTGANFNINELDFINIYENLKLNCADNELKNAIICSQTNILLAYICKVNDKNLLKRLDLMAKDCLKSLKFNADIPFYTMLKFVIYALFGYKIYKKFATFQKALK